MQRKFNLSVIVENGSMHVSLTATEQKMNKDYETCQSPNIIVTENNEMSNGPSSRWQNCCQLIVLDVAISRQAFKCSICSKVIK